MKNEKWFLEQCRMAVDPQAKESVYDFIVRIYNQGRADQNEADELAIMNTKCIPLFTQGTEKYINRQHALISIRAAGPEVTDGNL